LYEYIPKCFAQLVDDVVFEGKRPVVLEQDPLLKKVIPKAEPLVFSYHANTAVSSECQALFRVIGVGQGRSVETLGSVLAQKGIVEVVRVFPWECATVACFFIIIGFAGVAFKSYVDNIKPERKRR
jgi:hypothetical protein